MSVDLNRAAEQACRILYNSHAATPTETPSPYTDGYRASAYLVLAAAGLTPEYVRSKNMEIPLLVLKRAPAEHDCQLILTYAGPQHRYGTWYYHPAEQRCDDGHSFLRLAPALADYAARCNDPDLVDLVGKGK